MSAAGADLFDEMQVLNRRMLTRYPHAHLHWCACGNAVTCTAEPDRCQIPAQWDCPACELEKEAMAR
jgi:hypothetical protein